MAAVDYPCSVYRVDYPQDKAILATYLQWGLVVLGLALLFAAPLYLADRYVGLLNYIGLSIIIALGVHFLTGYCGIINLGQAGFVCVGALSSAILCIRVGLSPWVALPCVVLITGLVGLLFGFPALRIKGFYLVISTLAAGIIIPGLFGVSVLPGLGLPVTSLTVEDISIGGKTISSIDDKFFLIMPFMLVALVLTLGLHRVSTGRILRSLRDNELAAGVVGINVARYKLLAFFICGLFAGLGGWLWAFWIPGISTNQFPFTESIWYLAMIIMGGMSSVAGVVVGAIVVRGLGFLVAEVAIPELTLLVSPGALLYEYVPWDMANRFGAIFPLILSILLLLFLVYAYRGAIGWWDRLKTFYRIWPFCY